MTLSGEIDAIVNHRAEAYLEIVPATGAMPEMVEFTCRCVRQHNTLIRINGKWGPRLNPVHLFATGPCGRVERRVRPKRGPNPSVCDECLRAYEKDYSDKNRHWVDPPGPVLADAVYPEEIAAGFRDGTFRLGQRMMKESPEENNAEEGPPNDQQEWQT